MDDVVVIVPVIVSGHHGKLPSWTWLALAITGAVVLAFLAWMVYDEVKWRRENREWLS